MYAGFCLCQIASAPVQVTAMFIHPIESTRAGQKLTLLNQLEDEKQAFRQYGWQPDSSLLVTLGTDMAGILE